MAKTLKPLHELQMASPCPASWDQMKGDDKVRFCGECRLNVYNLSAMGRREAEELVRQREGRLCVRFYRRADGTVLTQDCPGGLAALQHATCWAFLRITAVVAAMLFLMFSLIISASGGRARSRSAGNIWQVEPFRTIDSLMHGGWDQGQIFFFDGEEDNAPVDQDGPPTD
jgi:hypothetical protein